MFDFAVFSRCILPLKALSALVFAFARRAARAQHLCDRGDPAQFNATETVICGTRSLKFLDANMKPGSAQKAQDRTTIKTREYG